MAGGQLGTGGVLPALHHRDGDNLLKSSLMKPRSFPTLRDNSPSKEKWGGAAGGRAEAQWRAREGVALLPLLPAPALVLREIFGYRVKES